MAEVNHLHKDTPEESRIPIADLTGELKEHEKLVPLLSQIPKKAQHGLLKSCDLILTCIDANTSFIALGTNVGLTFLYSRSDHSIQRLRSNTATDVITSVRLHHGIDDQLATGTASGDVTVYCMPGVISVQKKQLQKFDVKDMHQHYITCLEWSTNGMKLYSGDKSGHVVTTEVDFYAGQCQSSLLLVESATEITQLDYKHKVLLVSTRQRSFVVRIDQKCQLIPIGSQERKTLGPYGACFVPGMCKTDDAKLYAARPGCRLWLADMNGVVKSTHIFSEPLATAVPEISLFSAGKLQINQTDFQFGNLKWFRGKEIVTWSNSALMVLDPKANKVVARQSRLNGIVGVAVVEDAAEIFLLRRHAEARIIRISDRPEAKSARVEVVPMLPLLPPEVMEGEKVTETETITREVTVESAANSFFNKLANPFKKLEKSFIHDSSHAPQLPEKAKPATDMSPLSPDLPPVVKIASPELEGVRVFTGSAGEPSATASDSSATGVLDATHVSSSQGIPQIREEHVSGGSQEGQGHFVGESNLPADDPGGDSIVFSHRMKKQKKKKHKGGLLHPKEKDEDSISQQSAGSQHSDEFTVTSTPNNTPATFGSPLDTLKKADDMLKLVDNLLNRDSGKTSEPTPVVIHSSDSRNPNDTGFPVDEAEVSIHDKDSGTSITNVGEESQTVAEHLKSSNATQDQSPAEVFLSGGDSLSNENKVLLGTDVTKADLASVKDSEENTIKSVRTSSLSESDQHMEPKVPPNVSSKDTGSVIQTLAKDPNEILEMAMANLESSKSHRTETNTHMIIPPTQEALKSHPSVTSQDSFQDMYSEIEAIESTDPFQKGYRREKSSDDFYSSYLDTSPESPTYATPKPVFTRLPEPPELVEGECSIEMQDVAEHRLANSWSEFSSPANIYSLSLSDNHVWFTDKNENIHYSSIGGPKGILWRKATGNASQISVSPSGQLVWRLHKGTVYAGTKISTRHPEGLKWVEAVKDVDVISVDNSCAWYVKRNGDVMMQRGLSLERPCYKSKLVPCSEKIKHIVCRYGIVWAITHSLKLMVRIGVSDEVPEGLKWEIDSRDTPPYLFSHVAIDNERIGWAIDVLGQIWFCDGLSRQQPAGRGHWWQVPMSEYILHDGGTLDMIKAVARKFDPQKLSYILSTNRGGLITAGLHGVWLALDFRNVLQVCRGSVQGYHWLEAQPAMMARESSWKHVSANIGHLDWGLIWAQAANGDVYTFKRARSEATMISDDCNFCCISAGPSAVWALTADGGIQIRAGMGSHCPQGSEWVDLDLSQLGDAHIVHLSCNSLYVWAVESEGVVYQRIGAKPPSERNLSPVWLPIETFADIVFTRVHTAPLDWMVWAIDNRRLTYVRVGVTENMPIGQEWIHVPGIQAMDLALTRTGVWALTPNGEVFFRYGIVRERPCGNYWKKIPGTFVKISASANDELWGINTEGQLMQCSVKYLKRQQDAADPLLQRTVSTSSTVSEEVDWEIV